MPKLLNENEFDLQKRNLEDGFEVVRSCNDNNCVQEDTKVIIVGTLTPPEGAGYFYTAPRNKIYGYLDQSLENTDLKVQKKRLLEQPNNKEIIDNIKQTLMDNKIAFLDVIEYAIRKDNSPADKDIKYYTLDTEVFTKNTKAKYICNSIMARNCFLEICKTLNLELNYIYLSQRHATKKEWIDEIRKSINI